MIVLEGIIGSGKTTLMEYLESLVNLHIDKTYVGENKIKKCSRRPLLFYEPVRGNPYLESFYKDMKKWGLEMQFWLMSKRFQAHNEAVSQEWFNKIETFHDRSIYGDSVFCEMLYDAGLIEKRGFENYNLMAAQMCKMLKEPNYIFFLDTEPEIALERIKGRGRESEQGISVDYLISLRKKYYEKIIFWKEIYPHCKIKVVEWNDLKPEQFDFSDVHFNTGYESKLGEGIFYD